MNHSRFHLGTALFFCAICLVTDRPAHAAIIAEHSGATNPSTEGFVVPSGYDDGNGKPVYNDLGLGINAWNINGSWCCSGEAYELSSAQETALTANDWVMTAYFRDLSTTCSGSFGPNSCGGGVTVGVGGLRFSIGLHSDGHGDQVLAPDPFAGSPTYTIKGLGMNYALFQVAYDAATKTANYYVNGKEVLTDIHGYTDYYENQLFFGGQDSNFNLVELQSDTTLTSTPEPATLALVGLGILISAFFFRRRARVSG